MESAQRHSGARANNKKKSNSREAERERVCERDGGKARTAEITPPRAM